MFKKLNEISNQKDLKFNEKSINQTQRNNLIQQLTEALTETLAACSGASKEEGDIFVIDNVKFAMVNNKTIEFEIDNENVGFIPLKISLSIPNFDDSLTLNDKVEDYKASIEEKQKQKQKKEEEKEAKKNEKIKQKSKEKSKED